MTNDAMDLASVVPEESTTSSTKRKSSVSKRFSSFSRSVAVPIETFLDFLTTYKFSDPRWLLLPGGCACTFCGLGIYIAYCQLLEAKPIDIDTVNTGPDEAFAQIINPKAITPCLDYTQSVCVPQYLSMAVFVLISVALACLGCTTVRDFWKIYSYYSSMNSQSEMRLGRGQALDSTFDRSNVGEDSTKVVDVRPVSLFFSKGESIESLPSSSSVDGPDHNARGSIESLSASEGTKTISQLPSVFSKTVSVLGKVEPKKVYTQSLKFSPGREWFWYRCLWTLSAEVMFQLLRLFVVVDNYASTSAPQAIAQMVMITLNIDLFMLAFYLKSELMYVLVNLASELVYIGIRYSLRGALSIRATSFLDWCTMAGPLVFCLYELYEIKQFILHTRSEDGTDKATRIKQKSKRKKIAIVVSVLATLAGAAVTAFTVHQGFFVECPPIFSNIGTNRPEGSFFPKHVNCWFWQFNMFLSPPCSCVHLNVRTGAGPADCGGMGPSYELLEPVMDHLQDVRFLFVLNGNTCPWTDRDLNRIASWKRLSNVAIVGTSTTELTPAWKDLTELQSLDMQQSVLEHLDADMLASWTKLERFVCRPCPRFESVNVFSEVDLPRLQSLGFYGSTTCPSDGSAVLSLTAYECIALNATRECNMPQWFLGDYVNKAAGTFSTKCWHPLCSDLYEVFALLVSLNGNAGLYSPGALRTYIMFLGGFYDPPVLSDEAAICLFEKIRSAVPFEQEFYPGSTISDGLTILEFLQATLGIGNCGDCPEVQEYLTTGEALFNASRR